MTDEFSRVLENGASGGVVIVVVAVEHIAHGHAEALVQLGLEPGREVGPDGIGENDAFRRHQECRVVGIVGRPIEISGDVDDFAKWSFFEIRFKIRSRFQVESRYHIGNRFVLTARR